MSAATAVREDQRPVALRTSLHDTGTTTERPIIGSSQAMRDVRELIDRVAPMGVHVLILGETGTGKELVARAIHAKSARHTRPFLGINCAAIPDTLMENELFGHEKGAFTGADQRRVGKYEHCDQGTLLLDEVGDMPLSTQARILRVLSEGEFERLGGNETVHADVRIIAATNHDLPRLVAEKKFRADLYYRLRVFEIRLPSLRERVEDVPLLVSHFLKRLREGSGFQAQETAPPALAALQKYPWPGNVRELQAVLLEACLYAHGERIELDDLPLCVRSPSFAVAVQAPDTPVELDSWWAAGIKEFLRAATAHPPQSLDQAERRITTCWVEAGLDLNRGNQSAAARMLMVHRTRLRYRVLRARELPSSSSE